MPNLIENEKILLLIRRHSIFLKLKILPFVFIFILLLIFSFVLFFKEISWPEIILENFSYFEKINLNYFLIFIFSLILAVIYTIIILEISRYYLTYWIITNKRIMSANFIGFFNYKYENIDLEKIQDITIYIQGVLASFFNLGNLRIQTAGEQGQFLLTQVPNPELIKQIITEAKIDYLKT